MCVAYGQHPDPGSQISQRGTRERPRSGHLDAAHHQRDAADGRARHDFQSQRCGDEPGGRQGRRGADLTETECPLHGDRQGPIEQAQHHRNRVRGRSEFFAHGQPRVDVGQIVAGGHDHTAGNRQVGGSEHLWVRRIAHHHRNVQTPCRCQAPWTRVTVDDCHPPALRQEQFDHVESHTAESYDKHVTAHRARPLRPVRRRDPAAHQQVRQLREKDRHEGGADNHQDDVEHPQPGRLIPEREVAVADRHQGLNGRVQRIDGIHAWSASGDVTDVDQDRGQDREHEERDHRGLQCPVGPEEDVAPHGPERPR